MDAVLKPSLIVWLVLLFFLLPFISILFWSFKNGIGPNPTSPKQIKSLLAMIPPDLRGPIYELGSGWGTLALSLARRFPDCRVVGYENSPVPFLFSKTLGRLFSLPNLQFHKSNFFHESLEEASLVVCYLFPGAMKSLKSKLEKDLKPGSWVISNTFAIPEWPALRTVQVNDIYRTKIYIYEVPG